MKEATVICPVFNKKASIERFINSIDSSGETWLINDASTDGTITLLDSIAKESRYVKKVELAINQGVGNARNVGIDSALSEPNAPKYLYFLDADDWIYPDALKKMVAIAERDNAEIVCGQITKFDGENYTPHPYNREFFSETKTLNSIHEFPELALCPTLCNKLIRRSLIEEHGLRFDTERYYAEDFHFSLRAFLKAKTISIINEPVVFFEDLGNQATGTSLWNTNNPTRANNTLKSIKDMMAWLREEAAEPYTSMILFHSLYRLPRALKIMASGNDEAWTDFSNRVREWILSEFKGPVLPNEYAGDKIHKAPSALSVLLLQLIYEGKSTEAREIALSDRNLNWDILGRLKTLPCVTWGEGKPNAHKSLFQRELVHSNDYPVSPSDVLTGWLNQLRQLMFYPAIVASGQFDTEHYSRQAKGLLPRLMPRIHYLLLGNRAGLSPAPYFNPTQYYASRPDVAEAKIDAFGHFVKYGIFEL